MRALPIALSAALVVVPLRIEAQVPVAQAAQPAQAAPAAAAEPALPSDTAELPAGQLPAAPAAPEPAERPEASVMASWYGPGLWGDRTACGQVLTPDLVGVAHLSLPCGTLVTLRHGATTVTLPVVDNGPHVPGREFDLTYRARLALGCPDLCYLAWVR